MLRPIPLLSSDPVHSRSIEPGWQIRRKRMIWLQKKIFERKPATTRRVAPVGPCFAEVKGGQGAGIPR